MSGPNGQRGRADRGFGGDHCRRHHGDLLVLLLAIPLWVDEQPLLAVVTYRHLIREMACWGLTENSASEIADATLAALADSYAEAAQAVPEVSPEIVADCETRTATLLRHR